MTKWDEEAVAWQDRILKQKRDREAEIRRQLGWSDTQVGLYTIDTFLPVHHSSDRAIGMTRAPSSKQLAQKRQTHQRKVQG